MKKAWILAVASVVVVFSLAGCGGGGGGDGGGDVDTDVCGSATQGCITGNVKNFDGTAAVANATVTLNGTTIATANAQGWFSASHIAEADQVLCFEGTGYVSKCRTVTIKGGKTTPITSTWLATRGTAIPIATIETGGTAIDTATAAQVTFPAASVCDSNGTAVTGSVDCYLTPIDVTSSTAMEAGPNSFVAVDGSGTRGTMISSAMMELTCEQSGAELSLCSGKTATVRVPIYSTSCALEPNPIAGWRFNDTTGQWALYSGGAFAQTCGVAGQTDSYYTGTIDHMTWINGDKWVADACLTGKVYGSASVATTEPVTVACWGVGWRNEVQVNSTDGTYCIPVPSGSMYTCKVGDDTRTIDSSSYIHSMAPATTTTFPVTSCPASTCATLGDIVFANPLITTTLTWGSAAPASSDLDSHVVLQGDSTHIYYANKALKNDPSKGTLTASPWIALDTDDTDYSGPEITTVLSQAADGRYRFCVVNFIAESATSTFYSSSPVVHVSIPNAGTGSVAVEKEYSGPTSGITTDYVTWQVYEVNISSGIVTSFTELNTMTSGDMNGSGCWN